MRRLALLWMLGCAGAAGAAPAAPYMVPVGSRTNAVPWWTAYTNATVLTNQWEIWQTINTNLAWLTNRMVVEPLTNLTAASAVTNYVVELGTWRLLQPTNDVNFLQTTNRQTNAVLRGVVILEAGETNRALSFNGGWRWLGTNAPGSIGSNKVGRLDLVCYGASETNVLAEWVVEP